MNNLLARIMRSPRLGLVIMALSAPAMVTIVFAPWWATILSLLTLLGAILFVYAFILSPKYVHITDSTHPTQALKDTADTLARARTEIREAIDLSTSSALDVGHRLQNLQVNHDAQVHLAQEMMLIAPTGRPEQNGSLSDLAQLSSVLLKQQNQHLRVVVESATSLVRQLQINAIDAGHPEEVTAMRSLSDQFQKVLEDDLAATDSMSLRISKKLEEVNVTLEALADLSEDTEAQVRDAVMSMQYQDITSQKLTHVEAETLGALLNKTMERLGRPLAGSQEKVLLANADTQPLAVNKNTSHSAPFERPDQAIELFY